jgi:hypothetical protein
MPTVSLKEVRNRTGFDLIPDTKIYHYDNTGYPVNVRDSQRETERRYPEHKYIRQYSIRYFLDKGFDLYPRGIAIKGIYSSPDFAILQKRKIIFVECLRAHRVYSDYTLQKRLVEEFAPIIFVVEDTAVARFQISYQRQNYKERVRRLTKYCKIYSCNHETGIIRKFNA